MSPISASIKHLKRAIYFFGVRGGGEGGDLSRSLLKVESEIGVALAGFDLKISALKIRISNDKRERGECGVNLTSEGAGGHSTMPSYSSPLSSILIALSADSPVGILCEM